MFADGRYFASQLDQCLIPRDFDFVSDYLRYCRSLSRRSSSKTLSCGRWNPKETQCQHRAKTGTVHTFYPKPCPHQVKCYRSFGSLRTPKEKRSRFARLLI